MPRLRPLLTLTSWLLGSLLPLAPALAQTAAPPAPAGGDAAATQSQGVQPSPMDAELFYQLLIAELQRRADPGAAYSLILDAAKRTLHPELFRRAVEVALQGRAGNAALSAAREWSAALPQDEEARRTELQLLVGLQRVREAGPVLRDWIRVSPPARRAEIIALVPSALARTADKAEALATARVALDPWLRPPETAAVAWAALGRVQRQVGDTADALRSAQSALQADPRSTPAALLAVELLDTQQAAAEPLVLRHLQALDTGADPAVRMGYARALIEADRLEPAEAQLQTVLAARPDHAEAWLLLGLLQSQRGQSNTAEQSLQRYVDLATAQPDSSAARGLTQAYLQLADLASNAGDAALARQWLDRIPDGEGLLPVQVRRAEALARAGRVDDARALLQRVPTRNADERRRARIAEARLLRDHDRPQDAYAVLAQALQEAPDDTDLLYEQAMAAEKLGRLDEMERLLRDLIARNPDEPHAYNALGYALADRGERLDEAKALIEKALARAPEDAYIIDSLGWVEFRLGRLAEARRLLEDAMRRRPDAEIAAHLGEVLWTLGEREQARAVWRRGQALSPRNRTLTETLRRLGVTP